MRRTGSSGNGFDAGITADMKSAIKIELENLEKQEDFTILFACESGSRAWGFPSRDSDYDVRFIYIHPQNRYLSIENKKEHLEIPITDNLDINGWDIRKALNLLWRSNATIFEWLQSPIIYCSRYDFKEKLFQLAKEYFSLRDTMNHYLGLTKKSLQPNPGGNEIKLKQYFYILRPLLAAMWIVKYREIPPMEFHDLLQLIKTPKLLEHIDSLLKKKAQAPEKDKISPILEVQEFIEIQYERCKKIVDRFTSFKKEPEPLDSFFRNMLQRVAAK
jgi:predicted nucleotidyltransferase